MPNAFITPKQFKDYVITTAHKNGLHNVILLIAGMIIKIPKKKKKNGKITGY